MKTKYPRSGVRLYTYVFARTPVPIYCYLLLLLGLLPYLLPSDRLIILYSYHYTYHVLLVITILLLVVGYILQKDVVYVYTGPSTSIRTCSAIHHGWLCVPCEIADDKGRGLFFGLFLVWCKWNIAQARPMSVSYVSRSLQAEFQPPIRRSHSWRFSIFYEMWPDYYFSYCIVTLMLGVSHVVEVLVLGLLVVV